MVMVIVEQSSTQKGRLSNAVVVSSCATSDAVEVRPGEQIAKTGLEVLDVRRRFTTSKQGKGDVVNVSEIEIGLKRMLVNAICTAVLVRVDTVIETKARTFEVRGLGGLDHAVTERTGDVELGS